MKRLALVVVVALLPVVPASAHDLVQGPTRIYHVTDGLCVYNRTGLSGFIADVRSISRKWAGPEHPQCYAHHDAPAGDLKVKVRFQKSSTKGPVFTWDRCKRTWGPVRNQQQTQVLRAVLKFDSRPMRNLLCGTGWYRIKGYAWKWINGAFRGGAHSRWSQPHWISF